MKKLSFITAFLLLLVVAFTAYRPAEKAMISDDMLQDFQYTVNNSALADRFELQFPDIVKEVTQISVHQNEEVGYYYTVYGNDANGQAVVDFFKTTEEEVQNEIYDYIQMTERTTRANRRVCREATSFPPPSGYFCHATNNGYVCGIEWWPGVCFLY